MFLMNQIFFVSKLIKSFKSRILFQFIQLKLNTFNLNYLDKLKLASNLTLITYKVDLK